MLPAGYTERTHCEICRTAGRAIYTNLPDVTFLSGARGSLFRCEGDGCGAVWANPFPDTLTIAGFYRNYYTHRTPRDAGEDGCVAAISHRPFGRARAIFKAWLRAISGGSVRFSPALRYLGNRSPGGLLDVGCGSGGFLAEAARDGWTVQGQELDIAAAETARRMSGAEVRVGDLLELAYKAGTFDAITLSNVLEHLPNPREIIAECRRLLRPGGALVSISPNPNSFLHAKYGVHWRGLEVPRHIFLLPPAALHALCCDVGFSRIECFSTPGEFAFMEAASAEIRRNAAPDLEVLPTTSKAQLCLIYAATMFGRDLGEWSVVVAER